MFMLTLHLNLGAGKFLHACILSKHAFIVNFIAENDLLQSIFAILNKDVKDISATSSVLLSILDAAEKVTFIYFYFYFFVLSTYVLYD